MDIMPKPQLPYVLHEIARGKHFFYFRRGKGLRVRLHGEYGSPEFMESYYNALHGAGIEQKSVVAANGTLAWLG